MDESAAALAIAAIHTAKARYFRGVDTADGALVRSVLADDCELDYRGCCTDPASGVDFLPAMNVVLRGAASWVSDAFAKAGIVSVHQGHNCEIVFTGDGCADVIWSFTDRMWFPPGGEFRTLTGYGHYHETYVFEAGIWKIRTTRITRLRVEVGQGP